MSRVGLEPVPSARARGSDKLAGTYTCPELSQTCHRPGSYNAFALPSRFGDELRYADGRVLDAAWRDSPSNPNNRPTGAA